MTEFKKDIKRIFDENIHINSFGWTQYTSTDDFEFKLKKIKINDNEVNIDNQIIPNLVSKYSLDYYFKAFGDYCDVKFNKDNSIIVKDYINF